MSSFRRLGDDPFQLSTVMATVVTSAVSAVVMLVLARQYSAAGALGGAVE
jgi:hypothetical protein